MTSLGTLVEPLKRELAVPGVFDDAFPDTTDNNLQGSLADGFSEAQLWGFFSDIELTGDEETGFETSEDLSGAGGALILAFAATRIIRAQLRSLTSGERYKAGPVEFELQRSASLLRGELDYLQDYLNRLIEKGQRDANVSASLATVFDNYTARASLAFCGGFFGYELAG